MWIVCKYKSKIKHFKKNLCNRLNDEIKFYYQKLDIKGYLKTK